MQDGTLLQLAETLYPPFSDLLYKMERRGVPVSISELRRIQSEADRDKETATRLLNAYNGGEANWNASEEVAALFYDKLGLPEVPQDARSAKYWDAERSTAYETVEWWHRHYPERRPELDVLRQYRRACRAKNYATDLDERARVRLGDVGWIHPTYGTYNDNTRGNERDKTGTATGRLSISNPPLQQIPRDKKKDPYRVRRAFVAPPGYRLVVVDQEQLEVRIAAHIHVALFGDDTLKRLCLGQDFHGLIAHRVFSRIWPTFADHCGGWASIKPDEIKEHPDALIRWCREQVKAVFYGLAYGKQARSFGSTLWTLAGDPVGEVVAKAILDGIFELIPAIPQFQVWCRQTLNAKGGMWDVLGIWRPLDRDNRGWRQAQNQPMQGSGARIAMVWMLIVQWLQLTLQVHDELHVLAPEDDADDTLKTVEGAAREAGERVGLLCPLKGKGKHGASWEDTK